jgi:predicted RNA-binding Zn-ribbon protein involved in translation (DUF1610 family)
MVIHTGAKVFRFHCPACDWEDIRTTGPSLLGRLFPFPALPRNYKKEPVKNEKCPRCGGALTKQRMIAYF